jgi:hypothetical protein
VLLTLMFVVKMKLVQPICCVYSSSSTFVVVTLGGLLGSVLAVEPKVGGLKPGLARWIFNGGKNP